MKAEVVVVGRCESYISCRLCMSKVVKCTDICGECSKCGAKMKINYGVRRVAANMILKDTDGKE